MKVSGGLFIVFEGGDGAGKSTQLRLLARRLRGLGYEVVLTRQPGGSKLGAKLRRAVLDPKQGPVSPRAELFLYQADRAQHVEAFVRPALKAGKVVLCDRYADSSTIYQGLCRGLGVEWVEQLNNFATGGLKPHLVVVLDVPVAESFARRKRRGAPDRIEREKRAFHEKVRKGFVSLARRGGKRYAIFDALEAPSEIAEQINKVVDKKLKRK